jgi:fermentation-respiration switch protein FrsA (DUF1100 family)
MCIANFRLPGSILLAGLLYNATNRLTPDVSAYDYNNTSNIGSKSPAIIVMHPAGGVKEQTASIWAEKLSQKGFVTLAYDASYQGEGGGIPHYLEDPAERISDVSSVVDYLARQDFVDADKIAVLGICGGGHSGLNRNIQIQKLVFRFNSIQIPVIQYSGFIQDVIPWQVLAKVNVSEVTSISTICSPRTHSPIGVGRSSSLVLSESYLSSIW